MNNSIKVYPSILSADFTDLRQSLAPLDNLPIAGYHIDVMDGHFVPNITFGPWICKTMAKVSHHRLDVHLMIEQAGSYIRDFANPNVEAITVHQEANPQLHRVVQTIRELGIRAGVSINPGTSVRVLETILSEIQRVLIMTVNPGFAAQQFLPFCIDKIRQLAAIRESYHLDFEIYVDGGISPATAPMVIDAGAVGLIAGNAIFSAPDPESIIHQLRRTLPDGSSG